ncbi:AAA family ATPase [Actinoplanes sp. NBC_00393]|uniref:ATP-binding protein n=1 Tax=Actinoplanes sp. NBC_00393 TaxID=2975953 RepID=UPI002E1D3C99
MPGDSALLGHFVGRGRELDLVQDTVAAARHGEGGLVLVSGESGVGKTSFCRQVVFRARRGGLAVAWGSCWSDGGAPPLWPWQSILTELGDREAGPLFDGDAGGAIVEPERFARFAAVTEHLAAVCARSPAVVVIDDVHAADPGAVLLTRFVARALAQLPLLLVLACRTEVDGPLNALWEVDREATVVPLDRFDLAETEAFLRAHGEPVTDHDLLRALFRVTDGHPLHLHRLLAAGRTGPRGTLRPGGLRVVIAVSLERLTPATRDVLEVIALLGTPAGIRDVAEVCHRPADQVQAAVAEAVSAGLATVDGDEQVTVGHDLVREVLVGGIGLARRTELHARAADLFVAAGAVSAQRLARRAYHAVRSASLSAQRAGTAVEACRIAARSMVRGFGYEQAAAMLGDAVTVHERAALPDPPGTLLVEWAEAILRCGRLTEARQVFERAAGQAEAEDDPSALARAALGLGGVWVNEHRTRTDWERVAGLQRRALQRLPADHGVLRGRLAARLAAERVYRGGPLGPVLTAVEQARGLGDGPALAEALSLYHHALLTPEHTHARLPVADELITVAASSGEGMLTLVGLCWRTVDLFHLGDAEAVRSLAELRARTEVLGCRSVRYVAEAMEVMLLIRAGRLDEAEAAALACFQLGTEVGDADALGYLGAHLLTIRWLQGRDAELLETIAQIADSPTLNPAEFGFQATMAGIAARHGSPDRARAILRRVTRPGLAALPQSSTWLAGMLAIVQTAHELGEADLARQAYDLLLPYADLPIMPSLATTCFGSTERALGLAAAAAGDTGHAVAHLERAVEANVLLGNRPMLAVTLADLAGALLCRGLAGDAERAGQLLADAAQRADDMGLTARSADWRKRLRAIAHPQASIVRRHRQWLLTMGDHQAAVPDRLGARYLAQLLTNPGRPISALQLAGGPAAGALATPGGQPILDERARAAYRRRVTELTGRIEAAEDAADPAAVRRFRTELDALLDELRQVTGRSGRDRRFPDPGERARTAVQKAIKRAIGEISAVEPVLGGYLAATVSTGATCVYQPDPRQPVHWTLH